MSLPSKQLHTAILSLNTHSPFPLQLTSVHMSVTKNSRKGSILRSYKLQKVFKNNLFLHYVGYLLLSVQSPALVAPSVMVVPFVHASQSEPLSPL